MVWAPTKANREAIRFWLDCLQIFTVVVGILAVAGTFYQYAQDQKAQVAAIKRDLERPYQEKKLALYLDAARVLARLANSPDDDVERPSTEARFWELYWGELAFVESRTKDETMDGPKSVESLMVKFCHEFFGAQDMRCSSPNDKVAAAIKTARRASKEVRKQWKKIGQ